MERREFRESSVLRLVRIPVFVCGCLLALMACEIVFAQQQPLQFGGAYAGLGERRQRLVDDWLARLKNTTGQSLEPRLFTTRFSPSPRRRRSTPSRTP